MRILLINKNYKTQIGQLNSIVRKVGRIKRGWITLLMYLNEKILVNGVSVLLHIQAVTMFRLENFDEWITIAKFCRIFTNILHFL